MNSYYLTFGQKYRREPHPSGLSVHPDGYVEIIASSFEEARATAIKDKRVNIRLSTSDLRDIQVRALEEGIPYQTLIASILHKYVTGKLTERTIS